MHKAHSDCLYALAEFRFEIIAYMDACYLQKNILSGGIADFDTSGSLSLKFNPSSF